MIDRVLVATMLALAIPAALPAVYGAGGSEVGNPGDGVALEFVQIAFTIEADLRAKPGVIPITADQWKAAVRGTTVSSEEQLFLDTPTGKREVDALNYPRARKIQVSRTRWRAIGRDVVKSFSLVLHEYMGIMEITDDAVVAEYTRAFLGAFVTHAPAQYQLQLSCLHSLSAAQATSIGNTEPVEGYRDVEIYSLGGRSLVFYYTHFVPRSMRPYDRITTFLGPMDCHFAADSGEFFCSNQDCASSRARAATYPAAPGTFLRLSLRSDFNSTPGCAGREKEYPGPLPIESYFHATLIFRPEQCSRP